MIADKDLRMLLRLQYKAFKEQMTPPTTVEEAESIIKSLGPLMFNPQILHVLTVCYHDLLGKPHTSEGVEEVLAKVSDLLMTSISEGEPGVHEHLEAHAAIGLMRASLGDEPAEIEIHFVNLKSSEDLPN